MENLTYDEAIRELQSIVQDLQEESIGIDELSEKVERASFLIQYCRKKLRMTESEVDKLLKAPNGA